MSSSHVSLKITGIKWIGMIQIILDFTFNGLILVGLDMISAFDMEMKSSNGEHLLTVKLSTSMFAQMNEVVVEVKNKENRKPAKWKMSTVNSVVHVQRSISIPLKESYLVWCDLPMALAEKPC